MATDEEKQAFLAELEAKRGYVFPFHRVLVEHDLEVMRGLEKVNESAYFAQRALSPREKELIFIVSLVVTRASPGHIESHIRKARRVGVPDRDILEAIEIALPEAGVVAFQHGVESWQRVIEEDGPYGGE
jgi:4-carboxymuconolactone decarboxylase